MFDNASSTLNIVWPHCGTQFSGEISKSHSFFIQYHHIIKVNLSHTQCDLYNENCSRFSPNESFQKSGHNGFEVFLKSNLNLVLFFCALISTSSICNSSCIGFIQIFSLFYIFIMKIDPDFLPTKVLKVKKKWSRNRYEVVFETIL